MQNIALEDNFSETAFVRILDAENYEIRWFSLTTEIEFCGHAIFASADVAITARAEKYDSISRYFAPANGIPENFVKSSIHTGIVLMWAEQRNKKIFLHIINLHIILAILFRILIIKIQELN